MSISRPAPTRSLLNVVAYCLLPKSQFQHIYLFPTGIEKRLVKFGRTMHLSESEVSALRLVAASTSVPVPIVYCAFRDEKSSKSYIVMQRIGGEMLGEKWGQMSDEQREGLLKQLEGMEHDNLWRKNFCDGP